MTCSVRRVLNFTYAWLFDLIGGTDMWEKDYAHLFDPDKHEDFDYVDIPVTPKKGGSGLQIDSASTPSIEA